MLTNRLRKNKWSDASPNQDLSHSKYISSNILVFRILRNMQSNVNAILGNFLLLYKLGARAQLSQSNSELAPSPTTSKRTQQAKQKHYHKVHQNWWNSIQVTTENSPFSNLPKWEMVWCCTAWKGISSPHTKNWSYVFGVLPCHVLMI